MSKRLFLAAAALLALTACKQPAAPAPAAPEPAPVVLPTEADAVAQADKLGEAANSGDAAKLMAFFAPNAVVVSPSANDPLKTTEANLADTTEMMKLGAKFTTNQREVQILDADTFVTTLVVTMDFKKNGRPTWTVSRITDVWQKQADGSWLVVNEHLSPAPKPVAARLAPLAGAASTEQKDAPPLGGVTAVPTDEKK